MYLNKDNLTKHNQFYGSSLKRKSTNQFFDDVSSRGSRASSRLTVALEVDAFNHLPPIPHRKLLKLVSSNKVDILFDSTITVYSARHRYVSHGILAKSNNGSKFNDINVRLYLTSAINHQIWCEFADRSKIGQYNKNTKLNDDMATKLINNLDIIDEKEMKCNYETTIKQKLINKTPKQVKLNILLHEENIKSLASYLGFATLEKQQMENKDNMADDDKYDDEMDIMNNIDDKFSTFISQTIKTRKKLKKYQSTLTALTENISIMAVNRPIIKYIKYVIIRNFFDDDISENKQLEFRDYLFKDIEWIDEQDIEYSKIVELQQYHTHSLIKMLTDRKTAYCAENKMNDAHNIHIEAYDGHRLKVSIKNIREINLKQFRYLQPKQFKGYTKKFGFRIKQGRKDSGITFIFESNNHCLEWITYLEHAININRTDFDSMFDEIEQNGIKLNTRKQLREFFISNEYDSDAIAFDVADNDGNIARLVCDDNCFNIIRAYNMMINQDGINNKFTNDFMIQDNDDTKHDSCSPFTAHFSFGTYFDYWILDVNSEDAVKPKYKTMKIELLENEIATISVKMYNQIYNKATKLIQKKAHLLKAQHVGINNQNFNIPKGTLITINHMISLIVYTDYTAIQKVFKKQCRKLHINESMDSLVKRNSEIAHWCRFLKESAIFYGTEMKSNVFYTGLTTKLMFASMQQHFECPLSTTCSINVANQFSGGSKGIILQLRAADPKTRYFDVSWISQFSDEKERLLMGCSLIIDDILIRQQKFMVSTKYVPAILMFEKLMKGHFVATHRKTQKLLYFLFASMFNLKDKPKTPPKYILALFDNMINTFKNSMIWINKHDYDKLNYQQLKDILALDGPGLFWSKSGIKLENVNFVKEFQWCINSDVYQQFLQKKVREYVESEQYEYHINENDKVIFHLECCRQYSGQSQKCAFFLHLDALPKHIEAIQVEYDLICSYDNIIQYQQVMLPHMMSTPQYIDENNNYKQYFGSQLFCSTELIQNKTNKLLWKVAVKITKVNMLKSKCSDPWRRISELEAQIAEMKNQPQRVLCFQNNTAALETKTPINWKRIFQILTRYCFFTDGNNRDIKILESFCNDEDIDESNLRNEVCNSIRYQSDEGTILWQVLSNVLHYDNKQRNWFYNIVLYEYFTLNDMSSANMGCIIRQMLRDTIPQPNRVFNFAHAKIETIVSHKHITGAKFETTIQNAADFVNIFEAESNVTKSEWINIYQRLIQWKCNAAFDILSSLQQQVKSLQIRLKTLENKSMFSDLRISAFQDIHFNTDKLGTDAKRGEINIEINKAKSVGHNNQSAIQLQNESEWQNEFVHYSQEPFDHDTKIETPKRIHTEDNQQITMIDSDSDSDSKQSTLDDMLNDVLSERSPNKHTNLLSPNFDSDNDSSHSNNTFQRKRKAKKEFEIKHSIISIDNDNGKKSNKFIRNRKVKKESEQKEHEDNRDLDTSTTYSDSSEGSSYSTSSSIDSEYERNSWVEYKKKLQRLFHCFAGMSMSLDELKRFLDIVEITKYCAVDDVLLQMSINISDNKITLHEFIEYFCDEQRNPKAKGMKKYIEKQVSWQLLLKALNIFDKVDVDHSGQIEYNEFKQFGQMLNLNDKETETLWHAIDTDNSGYISVVDLFEWLKKRLETAQKKKAQREKQTNTREFSRSHSSFYDDESTTEFASEKSINDNNQSTIQLQNESKWQHEFVAYSQEPFDPKIETKGKLLKTATKTYTY
eukprot:90703_1